MTRLNSRANLSRARLVRSVREESGEGKGEVGKAAKAFSGWPASACGATVWGGRANLGGARASPSNVDARRPLATPTGWLGGARSAQKRQRGREGHELVRGRRATRAVSYAGGRRRTAKRHLATARNFAPHRSVTA
ncbi:hypothetical protein NL676_010847 [Syzygium grande]|nr:hypothetical protein NL676_010847 [Syzygium grande]